MDVAAHYRHLITLGRDEFLAAAAPGVLVRYRDDPTGITPPTITATTPIEPLGQDIGETVDASNPHGKFGPGSSAMELFPLVKKPGASFPDRVTIGRISNNDVVISDPSVSRLHAYVKRTEVWLVADAGSKNGSWLGDRFLEPRREFALAPGAMLRLGDVLFQFFRSIELFSLLGGDHGRR